MWTGSQCFKLLGFCFISHPWDFWFARSIPGSPCPHVDVSKLLLMYVYRGKTLTLKHLKSNLQTQARQEAVKVNNKKHTQYSIQWPNKHTGRIFWALYFVIIINITIASNKEVQNFEEIADVMAKYWCTAPSDTKYSVHFKQKTLYMVSWDAILSVMKKNISCKSHSTSIP